MVLTAIPVSTAAISESHKQQSVEEVEVDLVEEEEAEVAANRLAVLVRV